MLCPRCGSPNIVDAYDWSERKAYRKCMMCATEVKEVEKVTENMQKNMQTEKEAILNTGGYKIKSATTKADAVAEARRMGLPLKDSDAMALAQKYEVSASTIRYWIDKAEGKSPGKKKRVEKKPEQAKTAERDYAVIKSSLSSSSDEQVKKMQVPDMSITSVLAVLDAAIIKKESELIALRSARVVLAA